MGGGERESEENKFITKENKYAACKISREEGVKRDECEKCRCGAYSSQREKE